MKRRLAIFMHGGLSGGLSSQGFPLITQLVNRLAEDFDLTVFSLASFSDDFKPGNYKVCCVPRKVKPSLFRWIYFVAFFFKNYNRDRYDVLYSFWGYPMGTLVVVLGKIIRRPSVVNILGAESANIPQINYGHLRKYGPRKLILWTCRNATELIAVSGYQVAGLEQYGMFRKAKIIPWGVNKKIFTSLHKELELPLKLIHVANLTPVKDQKTLIKAFQLVREKMPAKLRIVGPDFFDGKIQQMVVEMGLQEDVEFTGFIPNKDIVVHYHWADAFVLTSLSEGQNNSITEAMMCGLLPVSTSVGIMHDLGNTVGIVEKPGDYAGLAKGLFELYAQPHEWRRRQQAAKTWANTHDFDWTINQLMQVIHGV